jgi:hypothetical protein
MLPFVNQSGSMETTVATQRRWKLFACATMLGGGVLAGVLVYGRLAARGKTLVFDLVAMPRRKSGRWAALLGRAQSKLTERL